MCVFCGPRVNFSGGCLHLQIQILRLTKAVAGLHGFPPQRRVPEVTTGRGACPGRGQDHGTKGTPLGPVDRLGARWAGQPRWGRGACAAEVPQRPLQPLLGEQEPRASAPRPGPHLASRAAGPSAPPPPSRRIGVGGPPRDRAASRGCRRSPRPRPATSPPSPGPALPPSLLPSLLPPAGAGHAVPHLLGRSNPWPPVASRATLGAAAVGC